MGAVLIIVLVVLTVVALPTWSYSEHWGYGPGGLAALALVAVAGLALAGLL